MQNEHKNNEHSYESSSSFRGTVIHIKMCVYKNAHKEERKKMCGMDAILYYICFFFTFA